MEPLQHIMMARAFTTLSEMRAERRRRTGARRPRLFRRKTR